MPRYYYHLRTERRRRLDVTGRECPNLCEAVLEAYVSVLRAVERPVPLKSLLNIAIDVTDCWGCTVFSLPFSSVIGQIPDAEVVPLPSAQDPRRRAA